MVRRTVLLAHGKHTGSIIVDVAWSLSLEEVDNTNHLVLFVTKIYILK